ncbi:MAG: hypothetical protein L3J04_04130 [Robiginitomaculum sp.]|nr:hypothetical protein [Robiginitomaculum sp.]
MSGYMALSLYKRSIAAVLPSFAAGWAGHVNNWGDLAKQLSLSNDIVAPIIAVLPNSAQDFLFVQYPGPTIFVLSAVLLFSVLLLRPFDSVLAVVFPDPPDILDRQLIRKSALDIEAYAPDQDFLGREKELAAVYKFATGEYQHKHAWMCLHGRMGHGKTRLALEWLKQWRKDGWDAGVLGERVALIDVKSTRIRKRTAIVIDNANSYGDLLQILTELFVQAKNHPLRVILVDQSNPVYGISVAEHGLEVLNDNKRDELRLRELDQASAVTLGEANGWDATNIHQAEGRPLLLRLGTEPWAEISRRAKERLILADQLFGSTGQEMLAFIALAGPINEAEQKQKFPQTSRVKSLARLFEGESRKVLRQGLPGLHPNILAGEILLQWLAEQQAEAAMILIKNAIEHNPKHARNRIDAMIREQASNPDNQTFPERTKALKILDAARPDSWAQQPAQIIDELHTQQHNLGEAGEIDAMITLHQEIKIHATPWPNDLAVQQEWARSLFCLLSHLDHLKYEELYTNTLKSLNDLQENFADDSEIALQRAKAAFNATSDYGRAALAGEPEFWDKLTAELMVLDALRNAFVNDSEIALQRTNAAANAALHYGNAALAGKPEFWDKLTAELTLLDALRNAFVNDSEIALQRAKAAVNAILYYGRAALAGEPEFWDKLTAELMVLDTLRNAFPSEPKIALARAKAAFNAILDFDCTTGKQQQRSEIWKQLAYLSLKWSVDRAIQAILSERIPELTYLAQEKAGWPYGVPPKS